MHPKSFVSNFLGALHQGVRAFSVLKFLSKYILFIDFFFTFACRKI